MVAAQQELTAAAKSETAYVQSLLTQKQTEFTSRCHEYDLQIQQLQGELEHQRQQQQQSERVRNSLLELSHHAHDCGRKACVAFLERVGVSE